ncbi:MAG: hypothetical protein U5L09_17690 [Bacteroidales bacterium]|nr:hypothetical protein [Bacteroidales bacterium]
MSNDIFQGYKGEAIETLKKFNIRVWSSTVIKTTRGQFEGTVLPRSENDDDQHIVLKIPTGYNIGIDIHTIENMEETGYKKANYKIPEQEFPYTDGLPSVKLFGYRRDDRLAPGLPHRCCNPCLFAGRTVWCRPRAGRHL